MGIVTGTFQETDGPHYGSVSLTTRTDYEEANNTGLNIGTGLPVDAGYYNYVTKTFTPPVNRGIMFPFVMKQYTWDQGQGTISQSPIAHNSNISINLGYSTAVAVGGESLSVGPWTITGDSLIGTNISFNTTTGYLESPSTSSYFQDSSFNVTVTDTSTGNAQTYSFTLAGSGVNNIRSFTGGSPAVPGNLKFGSSANPILISIGKLILLLMETGELYLEQVIRILIILLRQTEQNHMVIIPSHILMFKCVIKDLIKLMEINILLIGQIKHHLLHSITLLL